MTWLFGGFDSIQPPLYNGIVIPAPVFAGADYSRNQLRKKDFIILGSLKVVEKTMLLQWLCLSSATAEMRNIKFCNSSGLYAIFMLNFKIY